MFTLSSIDKTQSITHATATLFMSRYTLEINTLSLRQHLKVLNIDKLYIFFIIDSDTQVSNESWVYESPVFLRISIINLKTFGSFVSNESFNEINKKSLYILSDINWYKLVKQLGILSTHVEVTGGSSTKRHLVSKLDNRLHSYLFPLFSLDYKKLNAFNAFDAVDSVKYLPHYDFSNKK